MMTTTDKTYGPILKKSLLYILLSAASILMVLPFLWMISSSFKDARVIFDFPIQWIPENPVLENYVNVWSKVPFLTYYLNTIKVATLITVIQVFTSSLAAYSFSKIYYPERDKIFLAYLGTMIIPYQVIMIPQFMIIRRLGLIDTHLALILIQAFSPFGVFLFRQFFLTIPNELSEAARIDGASEFGIFLRVMLPLSKPAIASLAIFTFVFAWNDFLGPLIYINSESMKTLSLGLRNFQTEYEADYGAMITGALLAVISTIAVYLAAQDFFVKGIATTGLKG